MRTKSDLLKNLFLFLCFLNCSNVFGQSAHFEWAKAISGNYLSARTHSIIVDSESNTFITGSFEDTVDFDPGTNIHQVISNGQSDIFVMKLSETGDFEWVISIGGTASEVGNDIAFAPDGNLLICGNFRSEMDFDPDSSEYVVTPTGISSPFLLKLDTNGTFIWVKTFGGSFSSGANSLEVGPQGDIYVTGMFQDTCDLDPGVGIYNIYSSTPSFYTSKYSGSGDFVWGNSNGTITNMVGNDIAVNSLDEVYTLSKNGPYCLIQKQSSNGDNLWVKTLTSTTDITGYKITIDYQDNLLIAGEYRGNPDFDPGIGQNGSVSYYVEDAFVDKLDSDGNFIWAKTIGQGGSDKYTSIVTDNDGSIFLCGSSQSDIDFDPGIAENIPTQFNANFIQKLDSNGVFQWVKILYGYSTDITLDAFGSIYLTGVFELTSDFDPGPSVYNLSAVNFDSFIEKFSTCSPVTSVDNRYTCSPLLWVNGITYYNSDSSAKYTYNSVTNNGCDSIVTLNLHISNLNNTVLANGPTLSSNQNNAQYQWLNCTLNFAPIPNQTSQIFSANTNGSYAVQITQNNCVDTSTCVVVDDFANLFEELVPSILISPNPSENYFTIYLPYSSEFEINVTDPLGKVITHETHSKEQTLIISLKDQSSGLYLLHLTDKSNGKTIQRYLIKH